jgi:hypothetical protein
MATAVGGVYSAEARVYSDAWALLGTVYSIQGRPSWDDPLDQSGSWSFSCLDTAANKALLVEGRTVTFRGNVNGSMLELFSGELTGVHVSIDGERTLLACSGRDRMADLSGRVIRNLPIMEHGWARMVDTLGVVRGKTRWLYTHVVTIGDHKDRVGVDDDRPYVRQSLADPSLPTNYHGPRVQIGPPGWIHLWAGRSQL